MSNFIIYTQSGSLEPNMFDGLLLWLDVSEQGILSRDGLRASKMFDKSDHKHTLVALKDINKPQILQSLFDGKSALKFQAPSSKFVSVDTLPHNNVTSIGVIDGQIYINKSDAICIIDNKLHIPAKGYPSTITISEILLFETNLINEYDVEWIVDYLIAKWNISTSV